MSNITKGPWRTERNPSNPAQWMVIASTHETVVHQVAGGKEHAESNARVIAAAPEMAEILLKVNKILWRDFDSYDGDTSTMDAIEALLTKAGVR